MTNIEIPRRAFVKSAGVLALGFSVLGRSGAWARGGGRSMSDDTAVGTITRNSNGELSVELTNSHETVQVPARHFPNDWDFKRGDQVVVLTDLDGVRVAAPLVDTTGAGNVVVENSQIRFGRESFNVSCQSVKSFAQEASRDDSAYAGLIVTNESAPPRVFGLLG